MDLLSQLALALYEGNAPRVADLTRQALAEGAAPRAVLDGGLLAGMDRVGEEFRAGELFIPEVIVAARAMHAGIDLLRPLLLADAASGGTAGTIVLGTVKGDLHDIGKKLVGIMLQSAGLRLVDLGHDVAPERFVEAVAGEGARLVGLSALLSTTMPMMRATIEALEQAGLRERVKVLVGGAPLSEAFAREIGADGYAPDAVTAVERARELLA